MDNLNNLEKEKFPELRGQVNLGNEILGMISNRPGDKFHLERLWLRTQNISGHKPYVGYTIEEPTTAYIRTVDGNIYKADSKGEFSNGKTGETHQFDRSEMQSNPIFEVGKPFNFMGKDRTPPVAEIVYHDDSKHEAKEMETVPNASLIRDDFLRLKASAER